MDLERIFSGIARPLIPAPAKVLYAVSTVPGFQSYLVGKAVDDSACLLVATQKRAESVQSPIRLESLEVQFDLPCHIRREDGREHQGVFTVVRCRSSDQDTVRYFLSVCAALIQVLGTTPSRKDLNVAVNRLAAIFQKLREPATRTINGLFGELYLIWRSRNPARMLTAWRTEEASRFDFSDGNIRLDVKTASGRRRVHTFSYDQCNPPSGTHAIVASLFVERIGAGLSVASVIQEIERSVASFPALILKLREVVAGTLGTSMQDSVLTSFDERLAAQSLCFFDLASVPAIRGPLPNGVSEVHFNADLSGLSPVSTQGLIGLDHSFAELLPSP